MRKIVTYRILAITGIVIIILIILMVSAKMPNEQKNGFSRKFYSSKLAQINSAIFDHPLSSISGVSENSIFLTGDNPNAILVLDKNLTPRDTIMVNLKLPPEKMVPFNVYIDTPWLYISINNLKSVIHGKFPNQKLNLTEINTSIFTRSQRISPSSFIIKTLDSSMKKSVLQKIDIETGRVVKETMIPNSNQNNEWMTSDGMIQYNKEASKLLYVEYQTNKFYCLDSNLTILYSSKTIDTVSVNPIKMTKEAEREGQIKMVPSGARVIVNKNCFTDDKYIYIVSGLRADNEGLREFNGNSVIDIYNISTGLYNGSFYIPNDKKRGIKSAIISNDTLTALFNDKMITYRLNK